MHGSLIRLIRPSRFGYWPAAILAAVATACAAPGQQAPC